MTSIFISYSRVDRTFVDDLAEKLRRIYTHDNVWFDEGLHGGDIWWEEILDQIAARDIFIYALSNESVQSEYCQAEFEEARRLRKQIITVQARDRTQLTGRLSDIHYINMAAGTDEADALADLIRSINNRMTKAPKRRPRSLWEPRTPKPHHETETLRPDSSPEVDTPRLEAPRIERESMSSAVRTTWWRRPAFIVGAILILLVAVVILVLIQNPDLFPNPTPPSIEVGINWTETPTELPDLTATEPTSGTTSGAEVLTISPSPTNTPTPTEADAAGSLPTFDAVLQHAKSFSGGNTDWTPYSETFNGAEMVLVPVGGFELGRSGPGVYPNEQPADSDVSIDSPFWIDQTEVTWEMYRACLNDPESPCSEAPVEHAPGFAATGNMPVVEITWQEALDYCQWRGGNLPTEVQWEYAASGPDNWLYPWGDQPLPDPTRTVMRPSADTPAGRPEPVMSRPTDRSWVGAMDMAGNVAEWTLTPYLSYRDPGYADAVDDVSDPQVERVTRGGAYSYAGDLHTSFRHALRPGNRLTDIGFRCVMEIEE